MGITAETISVILFSRIGDFAMVLFTSDGITLGTVNDTSSTIVWEETVMFLLLSNKVFLITMMPLDNLEDGAGNVCTEVKLVVFMSLDGIGEQGTLAR